MSTPSSDASAPALTFYFVRHGETDCNRDGILQGRGVDSSLNDTGRRQADALAKRLRPVRFDAVYASTLRRAQQTADVLAEPHESILRVDLSDLMEMDWGVLEGEGPSEKRDIAIQAAKDQWARGAYDHAVDGGESIIDVEIRAHRAVRTILKNEEPGRTILVVSHGRFLRVLLASILDGYHLGQMNEFGHANTCVNRVVYRDGTFHAELLNCTCHLDTLTADAEPRDTVPQTAMT